MTDSRVLGMNQNIEYIKEIMVVTGGKGGIGKSFVSTGLALAMAARGSKVGLLDLDFTSPSIHVFLGVDLKRNFPAEKNGIIPPRVNKVSLMSLAFFSQDTALALRGVEIKSAFWEIMAITKWGELDYLIIDAPPGLSEMNLEIIRSLPQAEYLIIGSGSRVILNTNKKMISFLRLYRCQIIGFVANMITDHAHYGLIKNFVQRYSLSYLGAVPFDPRIEESLGNPEKLRKTKAIESLSRVGAIIEKREAAVVA